MPPGAAPSLIHPQKWIGDELHAATGECTVTAPAAEQAERILVVEDDPHVRGLYTAVLERAGYRVVGAASGGAAEAILHSSAIDVVITDLQVPKPDGLDILRMAKGVDPGILVILVTGFPTVETAVRAMKLGAADYLVKPFGNQQILATVEECLARRRAREGFDFLRSQLQGTFRLDALVGRSKVMLKLFDDIRKAATVDANVLILGESGSGKELVARAIHQNSQREGRPYVPINCAAIPDELLEAELFGHERGAFTGAYVAREGLLENAGAGTLFLDEVCELSVRLQAKLLRALEEGAVRRLGGKKPVPLHVRFIAATNRDIHDEMKRERFREDLFFRINVLEIRVPSLRERREDIPILAAHFLDACSARSGKQLEGILPGTLDLLTNYDWPGNVRELKNALERAVAYAEGPFITPADVPETVRAGVERQTRQSPFHEWRGKALDRLERQFLTQALDEHRGNVTRTAAALGIHRTTLQRLMKRYNLPAD